MYQREIKFRAWDDITKEMIFPNTTHEPYQTALGIMIKHYGNLMQFTGLFDIEGTPIYEGDILQRGVVTFSRGKFQGTYFDSRGDYAEDWEDDLYQERNLKVLGNIFQNPELLIED